MSIGFLLNQCMDEGELPKRLVCFCVYLILSSVLRYGAVFLLSYLVVSHRVCCRYFFLPVWLLVSKHTSGWWRGVA